MSRAYAGLSWRNASGFLAAGLSTEILFGAVKQEWAVRFDASGYVDTSDRLHRQYRGGRWTAGVQLQPLERLRLGAAWTPAGRSTVTWITSSAGAGTDSSEGELELGRNLSLGAGWSFGSVWAAYLDYTATAWDKAAWVTVPAGAAGGDPLGNPAGLRADSAVGIGLERRARPLEEQATFFDTLPLRLGVRFGQLYAPVVENDVVTGQRVSRFSVMLGSAFFIGREKMAWGDVTLQLGRYRAANNDHELFWRLTIGISGAERWFLPPQR